MNQANFAASVCIHHLPSDRKYTSDDKYGTKGGTWYLQSAVERFKNR